MRHQSLIRCVLVLLVCCHCLAVPAQNAEPVDREPRRESDGSNRGRANRRRVNAPDMLSQAIMLQGDLDGDQQLTRDELIQLAARWYALLDVGQTEVLRQQEFLSRFKDLVPTPQDGRAQRRASRSRANPLLGIFVVLDSDKDSALTRAEFVHTFAHWFDAWTNETMASLDRDSLIEGLRATLPRTNMGSGMNSAAQDRPPGLPTPPPSPVLPPLEAMKTIYVVDEFHLELAAAEPMIEDPIAFSFDEDGRLYVVEMRSYMLDIDGNGERDPIGRISRLEDIDGDGRFDQSTVFVDRLVLPRAVAAVNGGILYVADYQLYFARDLDGDGQAEATQLVDPEYGGGNIEHAPNGLTCAIDNWIYNARSQYRYRWIGDVLVKQSTENRGQWGISQDNFGRLFYNVNNSQLLGDYTPPNYMSRNAHHPTSAGLNLFVATDQRVFPIRMNTAVNRGYLPDVLDATGKLHVFASSCSPLIYRGDNFPSEFVGNAFVCGAAANLIKRNLVFDEELTLTSKFAYEGSEFLASTDERFRPVCLSNGPDGALWVVDMYRGISQYATFMTDYLRNESLERGLDQGIHFGRIYRIVSNDKQPDAFPRLSMSTSAALVDYLSHPNGWIRDTSQRLLIERADKSVVPSLRRVVSAGANELGRIHALWTLEGLFTELPASLSLPANSGPSLDEEQGSQIERKEIRLLEVGADEGVGSSSTLTEEALEACVDAMNGQHPQVQVAAIRVADSLAMSGSDRERQELLRQALAQLASAVTPEVLFQVALTAGNLPKPAALPILVDIATRHSDNLLIREAVASGLYRWEVPFVKTLLSDPAWIDQQPGRELLLSMLATAVMRERHPVNIDELLQLAAEQSAEKTWRRRSLLTGMVAKTGSRSLPPIRLKAAPQALERFATSSDPSIREQAERIKSLLAWPGHQFELDQQVRAASRPLTADEAQLVVEGKQVFRTICAGCHGVNGRGIRPLAAPLVDSDWVLGPEERLIRVLLHGLTGPVEVDGITYQPPLVLPAMPAVGILTDYQIAAVLSYIRREWGHNAEPVNEDRVADIRHETFERARPWTAAELQGFREDTHRSVDR